MRLAARKVAVLLWIGAVIVALDILSAVFVNPEVGYTRQYFDPSIRDMPWEIVTALITQILLSSGRIFVLGAVIWLLGDIRDRLAPPP